jgi:phage shock protein C
MATKRLVRPRYGKVIAGVCRGLADYFGVSVTLVRVVFLLFGVFGAGEIAYIVLWLLMPKSQ